MNSTKRLLSEMAGFATAALRTLPPEVSHKLTLQGLNLAQRMRLAAYLSGVSGRRTSDQLELCESPISVMGLTFSNRIGIAAGLDKSGDYLAGLGGLGVGFIEVGTVTPKPWMGNTPPRLWRYPKQQALVNRMGFNNKGALYLAEKLADYDTECVIGVSIGKQPTTALENATEDYLKCVEYTSSHADYLAINVSSPNSEGLRDLTHTQHLEKLIKAIKDKIRESGREIPLAVKLAPDMELGEMREVAGVLTSCGVAGVICTNTTISRPQGFNGESQGGLSGQPLRTKALWNLEKFRESLPGHIALIASGGIMTATDSQERILAGADLVQLYTGLIYRGPRLIGECIQADCEA